MNGGVEEYSWMASNHTSCSDDQDLEEDEMQTSIADEMGSSSAITPDDVEPVNDTSEEEDGRRGRTFITRTLGPRLQNCRAWRNPKSPSSSSVEDTKARCFPEEVEPPLIAKARSTARSTIA